MKDKTVSPWKWFKKRLTPDPMFHETEVQANKLGFVMLLSSGIILVLILILTAIDVFPLSGEFLYSAIIRALIEITVLLVICLIVKNDAW